MNKVPNFGYNGPAIQYNQFTPFTPFPPSQY